MKCPKCGREEKQHKVGKNPSGSQRYRCYLCGCKYTPDKKPHSYDAQFRQKAVQLYVDGMNLRRIGRHLGVQHQSVANWVKAHAEELPDAPVPEKVENAEMDELFTFISDKKTRCILGWVVVWERTQEAIQLMVDDAPKANWYFSDGFDAYARLWYHYGRYEVSQGKTIPILWKQITKNCAIIWLALLVNHAVFRAALTLYNVL